MVSADGLVLVLGFLVEDFALALDVDLDEVFFFLEEALDKPIETSSSNSCCCSHLEQMMFMALVVPFLFFSCLTIHPSAAFLRFKLQSNE